MNIVSASELAKEKFIEGTIGCSLAHLSVWKKFLSSNYEFALIFEDDAKFDDLKSLDNLVGRVLSSGYRGELILQLGWLDLESRLTLRRCLAAIKHLLFFRGPVLKGFVKGYNYGNHCYLINKAMSELLIRIVTGKRGTDKKRICQIDNPEFTTLIPLDTLIQNLIKFPVFEKVLVMRSMNNFAIQEGEDSNITMVAKDFAPKKVFPHFQLKIEVARVIKSLSDAKGRRYLLEHLIYLGEKN
jgi:hypothetical protein